MRISLVLAGSIATLLLSAFPAAAAIGQAPAPLKKATRYGIALAPGDAAPTFVASDLGGKPFDVVYDRSRATVVGFWSSTCVPCRVQSVALQQLFTQYREAGVQVIGAATDTGPMNMAPTSARKYLEELGGTYPVIRSTPEIETAWQGVTVLPTTFLIGKDGKLVRRYAGADDAIMKGLADDVVAYLAGRPLADQPFPETLPQPAPPGDGGSGGNSPR